LTDVRPSLAHISLQQSKNHILFIGAQVLSDVLNVNKGEDVGMLVLEERWCSKAEIAPQLHLKSDMCMVVPFSSVFEHGIVILMNFVLLAVMPLVMFVDHVTCVHG